MGLRIGLGWAKSHSFGTGQCPVLRFNRQLMMAILHNKVSVAKAVNVRVLPLEDAPLGYNAFDKGAAEKFVLDPHGIVRPRRAAAELVGAQSFAQFSGRTVLQVGCCVTLVLSTPRPSSFSAGHFSLDTPADGIAARVREFMDMSNESIQGEEIMAIATTAARPPFPPFTRESASQKVRLAEDAWNSRDPAKVALAYTIDSRWRNRSEFINGRNEIIAFFSRKWAKERDYRLIKEMWAFTENRIAVRFAYEWHDDSDNWYRSYGNENWEFNDDGLMALRFASINDLPILASERKYYWPLGRRPDEHPGLSDLGL